MGVPGTLLTDGKSGEPLAHVDGALERLALGNTGEEASGEGVTGTSGVGNLGLVDLVDREGLDLVLALDRNNGGLGTLGDDGNTLALLVLLGKVGEVLSDGGDVGGLEVVGLGVGGSLGLVADDVVPVGSGLVELLLEELGNERCVQGESERLFMVSIASACGLLTFSRSYLVLLGSLLGQSHDGGHADSKVVATNEVCLALLDNVPVLLEVVKLVAVGGSKVGAQAAVVASNNDTATASGLGLIDTVADLEAGLLGGICEDVGVLVLANAAEVDDGLGRKDVLRNELERCPAEVGACVVYLGASGGVLGGTTGSEDSLAVLEDCDGVTTGQMSTYFRCTHGPRRCPCVSPRRGWRRWPSGRTSGASPHRCRCVRYWRLRSCSIARCPYPKPVRCHTSVMVR